MKTVIMKSANHSNVVTLENHAGKKTTVLLEYD